MFGSVCSGIEAASVAWEPLGWRAAWFSEVDRFASAVLAHRHPQVKNLGDMTALARRVLLGEVDAPDVLCGGTPCQAFSVAGLRESLDDARGNLTLKFVELANAIDHVRAIRGLPPAVDFWENVPGVLSTKDNAFGCFLAGLAGEDGALQPPGGRWANAGAVYGPQRAVAWRTLDAQFFGLAQRRRRVFVVASARAGFDPATVLFEWDGLRRDTPPRREAREDVAACIGASVGDWSRDEAGSSVVAFDTTQMTSAANRSNPKPGDPCHPLAAGAHAPAIAFHGSQDPDVSGDVTHPVGRNQGQETCIAFQSSQSGVREVDAHATLDANNGARRHNGVIQGMHVRRLTPRECERLQGFPDGYTAIPWRGKEAEDCPDGPRYKALGNSWAVPVVRWIGRRLNAALAAAEGRAA